MFSYIRRSSSLCHHRCTTKLLGLIFVCVYRIYSLSSLLFFGQSQAMVDLCYYCKSSGCHQVDRSQKAGDIGQRFVIGHAEFQLYGFSCAATVDVARVSLLILSWCTCVLLLFAANTSLSLCDGFSSLSFHLAMSVGRTKCQSLLLHPLEY